MFHKCYFKKIRPSVFEQKGVIIMPSLLVSLSPQIYTPQLKYMRLGISFLADLFKKAKEMPGFVNIM